MNILMIMNKIILSFILFFACFLNADSQIIPLVGTWEGTYTIQVPDPDSESMKDEQRKMIIRIKQYDDEYVVKVKTFPVMNPSDVKYWNDCNVTYSNEQQIKWNSYIWTSYEWDSSDKKNGQVIYCVEYIELCTVTMLKGERLNYVGSIHSVYKNRRGDVIGTHDTPSERITLYKQEEDW